MGFLTNTKKTLTKSEKKPIPLALVAVGGLVALLIIQTVGYLLNYIWDIDFARLGFVWKGFGLILAIYLTLRIVSGKFLIDSRKKIFIFILILLLALFLMFGIEYILPPEFFSTVGLQSVGTFVG